MVNLKPKYLFDSQKSKNKDCKKDNKNEKHVVWCSNNRLNQNKKTSCTDNIGACSKHKTFHEDCTTKCLRLLKKLDHHPRTNIISKSVFEILALLKSDKEKNEKVKNEESISSVTDLIPQDKIQWFKNYEMIAESLAAAFNEDQNKILRDIFMLMCANLLEEDHVRIFGELVKNCKDHNVTRNHHEINMQSKLNRNSNGIQILEETSYKCFLKCLNNNANLAHMIKYRLAEIEKKPDEKDTKHDKTKSKSSPWRSTDDMGSEGNKGSWNSSSGSKSDENSSRRTWAKMSSSTSYTDITETSSSFGGSETDVLSSSSFLSLSTDAT